MAKGEIHVELYVDYAEDEKLSDVSRSARLLWVDSLLLAKRLLSDGVVSLRQIERLSLPETPAKTKRLVVELEDSGAFEKVDQGWYVSGFLKRNKSKAQIVAERVAAQDAAEKGNHQRWHEDKPSPKCRYCLAEVSVSPSGTRSSTPSGQAKRVGSPETETETETETVTNDRVPDRPRKPQATPPPDFVPITDSMKRWASEKFPQLDPAAEMEAMLDWHRSHGNRYTDWVATWRTWMRKAKPALPEYGEQRQRRSDIDKMFG